MPEAIINIRVLDNDTNKAFSKIIREAEKYRDVIRETSELSSTSGKDYLRKVEEQTRALERQYNIKTRLEEKNLRGETRSAIQANIDELNERKQEIVNSKIPEYQKQERIKKLEKEYSEQNKQLRDEESILLRDLKENFYLFNLTLREILEENKYEEADRIDQRNKEKENEVEVREEARKNFFSNIFRKNGGKTDEELQREREILERSNKGRSVGSQVLDSLLITELIKGFGRQLSQIPNQLATAQTAEEVTSSLWNAIPVLGGALSAASLRTLQQQFKEEEANLRFRAITRGTGNFENLSSYGLDIAEGTSGAADLAQRRGFKGNIERDFTNLIAAQNGLGVNSSLLSQLSQSDRWRSSSAVQSLLNVVNSNYSRGEDLSSLQNILEVQNQLIENQSSILENIDDKQNAATLAAFRNIGGSFADNRMGQRVSAINSALISPQNDYQQAMNYASLSQLKPDASFLEILKAQESGLQTKGFLKSQLDLIAEQSKGNEDDGAIMTAQRFGLSYSSAEKLFQNRNKYNDEKLLLRDNLNETELRKLGVENTGQRAQEGAEIANSFSKGMTDGLAKVGAMVGDDIYNTMKGFDWSFMGVNIGKEVGEAIRKTFHLPQQLNNSIKYDQSSLKPKK